VRQIIYFSTAADAQDARSIGGIASISYAHNARDSITGILVAGGHRYLQVIEGETDAAEAAMERIRRDRRHIGVTVLVDRSIAKRSFADWSMSFRGEPEYDDFSTLAEMVEQLRAKVADRKLRLQVDCFAQLFVLSPPPPPPSPWTLASDYEEKSFLGRGH
jgi:hypothetical protein